MRTLAGEFLAPTLRNVLDASDLEGMDRSQVTDLAYGAVRRLQQLDAHLAHGLKQPAKLPPRVLNALRLGVLELLYRHTPAHAAVSEWVEVVKAEAPGLAPLANAVLRGVERRAAKGGAPPTDPLQRFSLPHWLWREFTAALGPTAAVDAADGMLEPEPLWLTALTPGAVASLHADGCEVSELIPGAQSPASLRVRSPMPLDLLAAFQGGLVQPQNPASLQVALALGAAAGEVVFDLASGRGIKSAVLAASGARVTGVELVKRRARAAEANLERLRLAVKHVHADLVAPDSAALLERVAQANGWAEPRRADAVLLDAPCSGTGTLRGHPEIKLRRKQADLAELAAAQSAMLANAAALVAPGGRLLYAVCALTNAEGPEVVDRFLAEHPDYASEPVATGLAQVQPAGTGPGTGAFVVPVDGLDGFYLALLRRAGHGPAEELT